MPKRMKLADIVRDESLYPRHRVDETHVTALGEALRAGAVLPPLVVEAKSRRLVDGFHRYEAHRRALDADDAEVEVEKVSYADDAALYADAVRRNSAHGRRLTTFDMIRILGRGRELGIEPAEVARFLSVTPATLEALAEGRVGAGPGGEAVPLKRPFEGLAGKTLTACQIEANRRSSGMQMRFHVNQLLDAIRADVVDWSNGDLADALRDLRDAIEERLETVAPGQGDSTHGGRTGHV